MDYTILVVEDEPVQLESIAGFLLKQGYRVQKASTPAHALDIARQAVVDIVLSDFRMPGMSGVELLAGLKNINPAIEVIIMTAYGSVESAIEAMKLGAADYITKPVDLHLIQVLIRKTLERKQLVSENSLLRKQLQERFSFKGIISQSPAMAQVLNIAGRVAASSATVLITGETGTGKELVAKALHFSSPRRDKPFIVANCAALAESLLESELFGHEKGAFTGADRLRKGRFETAEGGTLFIDELGEIPLSLQVKLLRVLQERTFERVGSSVQLHADVRIVAATNRDLESMVREGSFRADLYYRLNVVSIHIPPLRERREDIRPLLDMFLMKFTARNGEQVTALSREALDSLLKYSYPGNVRELENIVEQFVVLSRSPVIMRDDLPLRVREYHPDLSGSRESQGSLVEQVEAFEQAMITDALRSAGQVQTRAAEILGISERHLRYKLRKYGMK